MDALYTNTPCNLGTTRSRSPSNFREFGDYMIRSSSNDLIEQTDRLQQNGYELKIVVASVYKRLAEAGLRAER